MLDTDGARNTTDSDTALAKKDTRPQRLPCPEATANPISSLFLGWVFSLVYRGWKKPLQDADLWELRDFERGVYTSGRVIDGWHRASHLAITHNRLGSTLFRNHRSALLVTALLKILDVTFQLLQPVFINQVLRFLASEDDAVGNGIGWAFALFAASLFRAFVENHYYLRTMRAGMQVRSGLQGAIYDKSLRMSPSARASSSLGEIVNLMQLDTQRIADFFQWLHNLWSSPVQILVSVVLLFLYIEWSAIIGLVITILTLPVQAYLMRLAIKLRKAGIGITDRRVKLMNEILQGIKGVKFYAWEQPFANAVEKERKQEIKKLADTIWIRSAFLAIMLSIPTIIAVITFSFFTGVFKERLDPAKIFTGIALLNQLRMPVMQLPMTINALIDSRIGLRRIEKFLDLEDTDNYHRDAPSSAQETKVLDCDDSIERGVSLSNSSNVSTEFGSIVIEDGEFEWSQIVEEPVEKKRKRDMIKGCLSKKKEKEGNNDKESPATPANALTKYHSVRGSVLQGISLNFRPGQLTAVVGRVGSGKSSLFHAILGEMRKVRGAVTLEGSVAYVAQTAWIFNDTLRNNITFGKEFDEKLYKKAITVSALGPDIDILPAGDQTAIGEKGINLSGGQKQRVSIARAVYADAAVYLFDDPLSALDAHVSQEVFTQCISNVGALQNKLRILITNHVHVLSDCDNVVFLERGCVRSEGTYDELAATDLSFQQLINEQKKSKEDGTEETTEEAEDLENSVDHKSLHSTSIAPNSVTESAVATGSGADGPADKKLEPGAGRNLMQDEDRRTGNVLARAYYQYARACGGIPMFTLLLVFSGVTVATAVIVSWWLVYWAEQEAITIATGADGRSIGFYLGIYFGLAIAYAIMVFLRSVWFLNLALHASQKLHNAMLKSVLHAPMTFFDTTPIGRIVSRFSRDISVLDELLPQFFQQMLSTSLNLVAAYIFIGTVLPIFFAAAVPVTLFYLALQRFFNRTSVELKRLDSISKSPIYAHFSETLGGLSTLRAYGKQGASRAENMKMIDINQRAYFSYIACNRWFSLFLEMTGTILILATALFGVLARDRIFSGSIGLSLTYALQVTGILGFTVRSITEVEGQMNSVERAHYYCNDLPQEAPNVIDYEDGEDPGSDWPSEGQIEIRDVEMRYREGLELVLKGVNASIQGGEKVGVVGRTGSGKSSLMIALLRIVELNGGEIKIDGMDLHKLGLDDIRKRITIIPQDPVVFSGTIRFNLDPFDQHTEAELWDALEKSHLKQFVSEFEGGLDAKVSEYGENLSAGQRQVICLTRALLRNSKILILDEASSCLDMETDRLIQETIRTHLKHATILTIAHRLFTVADYDKVLVIENGVVVEFDSPSVLLAMTDGKFNSLVDSMGPGGSERFRALVGKNVVGEQ